jgi:hypothetical protein
VPEHQELDIFGHLVPGQHRQATQQTAYKQADDRNDHSAMVPARQSDQAISINRAPQDSAVSGRIFFDQVIRDNLDLGRPDQVSLIFDRKIIRRAGTPRRAGSAPA